MSDSDIVKFVLRLYDLGEATGIKQLGGTAAPKFAVELPCGRFVLRQRQNEFSSIAMVRFDHAMLTRLYNNGLPVPCPQKASNGQTWVDYNGDVYEVLSWVSGEPFTPGDTNAISDLGKSIAQFHRASSDNTPVGKEGVKREDHPDLLMPYVDMLEGLCRTEIERSEMKKIREQVNILSSKLENCLYYKLPMAVIHGDVHPGNVMFEGSKVSAVYDFDYMSKQARVRDVCDCLAFFASRREGSFDVDNIYSLTKAFRLDYEESLALLRSYNCIIPIEAIEFECMPELLRALWMNMRLRGSRKVNDDQKLMFILRDFWSMIDRIENESPELISQLQSSVF